MTSQSGSKALAFNDFSTEHQNYKIARVKNVTRNLANRKRQGLRAISPLLYRKTRSVELPNRFFKFEHEIRMVIFN